MSQLKFTVSPRQLHTALVECFMSGLVPYVESSPGMGKSAISKNTAKELNLCVIDHRLSTSPPEDLSGLPHFVNGKARFAPFEELFPLDQGSDEANAAAIPAGYDGWLLLLDEFPSAPRAVQAAAYKLILDRMIGQYKLHPNVLVMAAGNHATDRAIADPLGTAMQSRLVHLELAVDFAEWLADVALVNNYDTRIVAFLSQYESKLMNFNPRHTEKTFACPRTWEFVEKLIHRNGVMLPIDGKEALLAGTIGAGIAVEFIQFAKVFTEIVKIGEILKDPENCRLPTSTDLRWATVSMMMEHLSEDNYPKLCEYVERFNMDFKILFYRGVLVRKPELRRHPDTIKAFATLSHHLNYVQPTT